MKASMIFIAFMMVAYSLCLSGVVGMEPTAVKKKNKEPKKKKMGDAGLIKVDEKLATMEITAEPTVEYKVICQEGTELVVSREMINLSGVLSRFAEDQEIDGEVKPGEYKFPFGNIKEEIMEKVIEWKEHHLKELEEKEKAEAKAALTKDVQMADSEASSSSDNKKSEDDEIRYTFTDWERKFLEKMELDKVMAMVRAANEMETKGLLTLLVHWVYELVREKTPDEIRKMFGIKNEFPQEEWDRVAKLNDWDYDVEFDDLPEDEKAAYYQIEEEKKKAIEAAKATEAGESSSAPSTGSG